MAYHEESDYWRIVERIVRHAGDRARTEEVATSEQGRPITAVTLAGPGRRPDAARPQALITANIHGVEVIGSEVALGILGRLGAEKPYGAAARLLDAADVCVLAVCNPDGRATAFEGLARPLPVSIPRRTNIRGVDLNRNFPYPAGSKGAWHPLSGTGVRMLPWYRGEEPLSERESRAIRDVAADLEPRAAVALHSAGRLFLYPYCRTKVPPPDLDAFRAMGRAFRQAQPIWRYKLKQAAGWYSILGDLDDFLYETFGTLACTVEISRLGEAILADPRRAAFGFWWANPPSPEPYVTNDAEACLAALAEAFSRRG